MYPYTFTLDDLVIPIYAALDQSQVYEQFGGYTTLRTVNGSGVRQANWKKHRINLSGNGSIPLGLESLDHAALHTLKCGVPMSVQSLSNVITVPTYRRSDVALEGYAHLNDSGELVETAVGLSVDTATLTIVTGAIAYSVRFWPEFSVFCDPPQRTINSRTKEYGWTLNCEEA